MFFFTDFRVASQDILEQVGQEAALKDVGKDAKSMFFEYWDRFIGVVNVGITTAPDLSLRLCEAFYVAFYVLS